MPAYPCFIKQSKDAQMMSGLPALTLETIGVSPIMPHFTLTSISMKISIHMCRGNKLEKSAPG
jgi:hypothetical protein